ncbi:hypothetical protein PFNF54_02284 [Plasmodium falciparum NF54]|uniref:Uncharacterized protein n=1 Tax=Plasmodium falciparum (isolate NF54) TaxID=5843 RepID=W7K6E1_PLAFO|nr:hypothetical protein PFNF54_02284 [Plasmodium falciparum NF54]
MEKIKILFYIIYYILYINHFSCDKNQHDTFLRYFLFYTFQKKSTLFNIYPLLSKTQKWLPDEYKDNLLINYVVHTCCSFTKKKIQKDLKKYLIKLLISKKHKYYQYFIKLLNEEDKNIAYFKKDIFKNTHAINEYKNIHYNKNTKNEQIYNNFINNNYKVKYNHEIISSINKNSFVKDQRIYLYNKQILYYQQQFYNYVFYMFRTFYENLKLFLLPLLQNIYHNRLIYINVYMYLFMIRSYYYIQKKKKINIKNVKCEKCKIYKKCKKYQNNICYYYYYYYYYYRNNNYNNKLLINYSSEGQVLNIKDITCTKKSKERKQSIILKYYIINLCIHLYNYYLFMLKKNKVKKCNKMFLRKYLKLLLYIGPLHTISM